MMCFAVIKNPCLNLFLFLFLLRATEDLKSHTVLCKSWSDFITQLEKNNIILAPFCGLIPCEDLIKKESAR